MRMQKLLIQGVLCIAWLTIGNSAGLATENKMLVALASDKEAQIGLWLESSLSRVFPSTPVGKPTLDLLAARNSTNSFQACIRNDGDRALRVDGQLEGADGLNCQVRLVGLVPLRHVTPDTISPELDGNGVVPGLVPDPLYTETETKIGPHESRSFWITVKVPAEIKPGRRELRFRFLLGDKKQPFELPVNLEISRLTIQPRHDFPVTHWWRGEATWNYYQTGMFEDERWWELTRNQLQNLFEHGTDVAYVPMWFSRRETFKRPCQLLSVREPSPGHYEFDWTHVKRFLSMAREIGFKKFEWPQMWIYWGLENPMRIYKRQGADYVMLWPPSTPGFSEVYLNFLRQFLPEYHKFLESEAILDQSYFHLSDEPGGEHVENYKRARQILRDLAPWMKVMDALSDIQYGKQGLTDIPIPLASAAQAYIDAGIPHWVYVCTVPRGPWMNRFMDTPLPKIRMSGWLFYRLHARGFLHWGYNYWDAIEQEKSVDPFTEGAAGAWPDIPYGDPFVVYPGKDRPIDSIRWEVFAESLQDYALLQTAEVDPDGPLLSDLKSYAEFPKHEDWIRAKLRQILRKQSD